MIRRTPEPYAPTILIVDDDPQIQRLCSQILEEAGYFVREARNGKQALV
jgi:CheY-like chemotaxis protein